MRGDQTIFRLRGEEKDRNGDPIPDTGESKRFEGCLVYPRTEGETTGNRQDTTVIGQTVYVPPPNVDVESTDVILWKGDRYEIDGDPAKFHKASGDKGVFINIVAARG